MSAYAEIPGLGGPKDGHFVRRRIRKDGTVLVTKRVFKTKDGHVLYGYSDAAKAFRFVARCDENGRIPLYLEKPDGSFVPNVIHFEGD